MALHTEIDAPAAAINERARTHRYRPVSSDDIHYFASRPASRHNILDDQRPVSVVECKTSTKSHLPGGIALGKERSHAKCARHFVSDNDAAESRSNDDFDSPDLGIFSDSIGKRGSKLFGKPGMLEHEGGLKVTRAVEAG
jgi:hypothetical protein